MRVLVACEESQTVCAAFRARGHEAYSCDIQTPSGGHPEWHILGDAMNAICAGVIETMDGVAHDIPRWDLMELNLMNNTGTRQKCLQTGGITRLIVLLMIRKELRHIAL